MKKNELYVTHNKPVFDKQKQKAIASKHHVLLIFRRSEFQYGGDLNYFNLL